MMKGEDIMKKSSLKVLIGIIFVVVAAIAFKLSGTNESFFKLVLYSTILYITILIMLEKWFYVFSMANYIFRPIRLIKIAIFAIISLVLAIIVVITSTTDITHSIIAGLCLFLCANHIYIVSGIANDLYALNDREAFHYAKRFVGRGFDHFLCIFIYAILYGILEAIFC